LKLSELRQKRSTILDQMEALTVKLIDENRDFNDDERKEFDGWKADDIKLESQIKSLEEIQSRKAAAATIVTPTNIGERKESAVARAPKVKGQDVATMVRSLAEARGDNYRAAQIASEKYGNEDVARQLAAGPVEKAMSASVGTAGGYMVNESASNEFIELLRPASTVYQAGARVVPMPAGNMTFGKMTAGATAGYGEEGDNATASQATLGQVKLKAKKLTVLCPVSNDLLRYASPQADQFIVNDLVASTAQRGDLAFLRGDGTADAPRGLRYWASSGNINAINGTVNAANVEADVWQKLVAKLAGSNVSLDNLACFMAPRTALYLRYLRESAGGNYVFPEMADGMLAGAKVWQTTQLPITLGGGTESEIIFANMAHVLIGETMGVRIDVSDTAAYHDGSNVVAAFSKDQTVIRVIVEHDLGVRHPEAVAVLTGSTWGA
jgi:HK97 family phage major capsid protein